MGIRGGARDSGKLMRGSGRLLEGNLRTEKKFIQNFESSRAGVLVDIVCIKDEAHAVN
jgi:hypothetical protein